MVVDGAYQEVEPCEGRYDGAGYGRGFSFEQRCEGEKDSKKSACRQVDNSRTDEAAHGPFYEGAARGCLREIELYELQELDPENDQREDNGLAAQKIAYRGKEFHFI
jgi:hypothetical protein